MPCSRAGTGGRLPGFESRRDALIGAAELDLLRALEPHPVADLEKGLSLLETSEQAHRDRSFWRRRRSVAVIEPADLAVVLMGAVEGAGREPAERDIAGDDAGGGVLRRKPHEFRQDQEDLAARVDGVPRLSPHGQCGPDGLA